MAAAAFQGRDSDFLRPNLFLKLRLACWATYTLPSYAQPADDACARVCSMTSLSQVSKLENWMPPSPEPVTVRVACSESNPT